MKKGWNGMTGDLTVKSVVKGNERTNKFNWSGKFKIMGPTKASVQLHTGINGHKTNMDLNNIDFENIDPSIRAKFQKFIDNFKQNMVVNMNRAPPDPEIVKWAMNLQQLMQRKNKATIGIMGQHANGMMPGSPTQPIFQKKRAATKFRRRAPRRAKTRGKPRR